jgi:hypothetical protein
VIVAGTAIAQAVNSGRERNAIVSNPTFDSADVSRPLEGFDFSKVAKLPPSFDLSASMAAGRGRHKTNGAPVVS